MNFTEEEKVAILKAMDLLIKADEVIDIREVDFLEVIADEFGLNPGFLDKIENFQMEHAMDAIQTLSPEKLTYIQTLLTELALSDRIINQKEIEFIDKVNAFIKVNS